MGIGECKDCGAETIDNVRCASCWNDRFGEDTSTFEQALYDLQLLKYKMSMIVCAVKAQARDQALWAECVHISEAYLQESLRDLHRVIEDSDTDAMNNIYDRTSTME